MAFPNLTRPNDFVQVKDDETLIFKKGDELSSGMQNKIPLKSKYHLIEAYNRPWHSHDIHHLLVQVKPYTVGRFVIFVKTIALPYTNELSHYPREGIKDQQGEFVNVYSINVFDGYLGQSK